MAAIDLVSSAWLEIGIGAAAAGDHARAVSALTAISDEDWAAIRARVGDDLFTVFTAPLSAPAGSDDFDKHADQALALFAPQHSARPLTSGREP